MKERWKVMEAGARAFLCVGEGDAKEGGEEFCRFLFVSLGNAYLADRDCAEFGLKETKMRFSLLRSTILPSQKKESESEGGRKGGSK